MYFGLPVQTTIQPGLDSLKIWILREVKKAGREKFRKHQNPKSGQKSTKNHKLKKIATVFTELAPSATLLTLQEIHCLPYEGFVYFQFSHGFSFTQVTIIKVFRVLLKLPWSDMIKSIVAKQICCTQTYRTPTITLWIKLWAFG